MTDNFIYVATSRGGLRAVMRGATSGGGAAEHVQERAAVAAHQAAVDEVGDRLVGRHRGRLGIHHIAHLHAGQ